MVLDFSLHRIADRSVDTNNSVSKPTVDAYVDAVVSSAINVTQTWPAWELHISSYVSSFCWQYKLRGQLAEIQP